MNVDIYINPDCETVASKLEYHIRMFELIEFYKLIKKNNEIVSVYFDTANHIVSFIVKEKVING
ncbi:hypothetical protein ES702_00696 [subsurface metagenome]